MSDLLVYERRPQLAAWFARLAEGFRLREVRSLTQLRGAIRESVPCVLCVEVDRDELLEVADIVHYVKCCSGSPVAVLAMPTQEAQLSVLPLFEAGVDAIFESVLDHQRVAGLLRRAKKAADHTIDDSKPLRSEVWSRIPWKSHAIGSSHTNQKGNNKG